MSRVINPDVKPVGDSRSHRARMVRLGEVTYSTNYDVYRDSPFFTPEATRDIMEGTQFDGENHRRITPYLQASFSGDRLLNRIDSEAIASTYRIAGRSSSPAIQYDVVIIGSGPHGAGLAAYLAEKRPDMKVLIIEKGNRLGGQFRSYGPKPVFQMNSRVRKADRRYPSLPRSKGSINPLGMYAPLELSDVPTGVYAWNIEMGSVCAINAFMSADVMVNTTVVTVRSLYEDFKDEVLREVRITTPNGDRIIVAPFVVDATGLKSQSRVTRFESLPNVPDGYFTGRTFYEHFANHDNPLERFHERRVMVIGRGDSALTALEAMIGNLPTETYGRYGVGRMRPAQIDWFGAVSTSSNEIEGCLRTRYKNGIVQSLKRDGNDEGGLINPSGRMITNVRKGNDAFFDVTDGNGDSLFPEIVIDCTNQPSTTKFATKDWEVNYFVGPNCGRSFNNRTLQKIDSLRLPESVASLWALMSTTDEVGAEIATMAA